MRLAGCASLILVASLSATETVASEGDKAAAGALITEGNERLAKGDFAGALEKYKRAHAAYPSPKIFFNLGEAHRELGQTLPAADAYARFLAEAGVSETSELHRTASAHLHKLDQKLGRVEIGGAPEGTRVFVDGHPVGEVPLEPFRVEAGRHELTAEKPGFIRHVEQLDLPPNRITKVELALRPVTLAVEPAVASAGEPVSAGFAVDRQEVETPVMKTWWFWTAIGVGAVVVLSSTAIIMSSGGDDFVPRGELGNSTLSSDWIER